LQQPVQVCEIMSDQIVSSDGQRPDRRGYRRLRISVPVEMNLENSEIPVRGATSDLSAGGCYIETMYPFPAGTVVDMKLQLENTLLIAATVVTCFPQVGNGIQFTRMLPEDREELQAFLDATEAAQRAKEGS
jgi:c-di-GMP-binding flagellar brake protein YcgR